MKIGIGWTVAMCFTYMPDLIRTEIVLPPFFSWTT